MRVLGVAVDENGSQFFLCTDLEAARAWKGASNGTKPDAPVGSDWAVAFRAVYGKDIDALEGGNPGPSAHRIESRSVDVVDFGVDGWKSVFEVDGRIVLVEVTPSGDETVVTAVSGEEVSLPDDPGFEAYVCAPPDETSARLVLAVPSGQLLVQSATDACATLEDDAPMEEDAVQADPHSGGKALFVKVAATRYRVHVEAEQEHAWGAAQRVVLVPRPAP